MTTAGIALSDLSEMDHRKQLRRAVVASVIGTTIEWYDFFIYGIVTGLVFAKLYFPQSDPLAGTLQAYAVFFVGFVARPIGAAIFGHLRRSYRSQVGIDRDIAADGAGDLCRGLGTHLRAYRLLGAGAADRTAFHPRRGGGR